MASYLRWRCGGFSTNMKQHDPWFAQVETKHHLREHGTFRSVYPYWFLS